jgi:hypothetical protein
MTPLDTQAPRAKRRKVSLEGQSLTVTASDPVPITSHTQLRDLLGFQQGSPSFEVKRSKDD